MVLFQVIIIQSETYVMSPASGKLPHQWENPTVTVLATASINKNAKTAPNNKSRSHICSLKVMHTDHAHISNLQKQHTS